jgi:hypothetical protein
VSRYFINDDFSLVTPAGVEPAIFWMRTRRPGPLDEGAMEAKIEQGYLIISVKCRPEVSRSIRGLQIASETGIILLEITNKYGQHLIKI